MSGKSLLGSVAEGEWAYYKITSTDSDTELQVSLTNLSNDLDLYVRAGSKPTTSTYECRPYHSGSTEETCTFSNPGATTWHIGVHGYTSGSFTIGATLTANECVLDSRFETTALAQAMEYYNDRTYRFTNVPSDYIGLPMIKTPNDERNRTDVKDYVTFEMPQNGVVYVGFDSRAMAMPEWLDGFTYTGKNIYTSLNTQPHLKIYGKSYSKGDCINFGANKALGFSGNVVSNYVVFYGTGGVAPTCTLSPKFVETRLSNGIKYYSDRGYTLRSVPSEYTGMDTIITPNDDRNMSTATGYLTFKMPYDGTVYIAYDSRASNEPEWMNGFIDTGDVLLTSLASQPSLKIYSQIYYEGDCVDLGANKAPGFAGGTVSNYIAFYGDGNVGPSDCELDTTFDVSTMVVGTHYYIDREYMITGGVPAWMLGRMMIQAPNDDRFSEAASGYIRFTNLVSWWVYVLFDSRSASIPAWLNGWELRSDKITTSLGSQPYLKVYRKMFDAGQCVDLGGNYGPGSSGENRSNYVVVYGQ